MLKISEIFEFSSENSYFERIRTVRTVRMVRMVRSLADRTFQLCLELAQPRGAVPVAGARPVGAQVQERVLHGLLGALRDGVEEHVERRGGEERERHPDLS